jgi:hypothetical protein
VDDHMKLLLQEELGRAMERHRRWLEHPVYKAYREKRDREWKAKPWYERAWIRTSAKVGQWRVRIGEIIAGCSFDD